MARSKHMLIGVGAAVLGGSLWGVSGNSVHYLTTAGGASPALVTWLRLLIGGLIFLTYLLIARRQTVKAIFTGKRNIIAIFVFAFSLYMNQLSYAQTVQITNAGTATVLTMLGSVFVMLYVCIKDRHLPKLREFIGLVLAITASVLIATQGDLTTINIPLDGLIWGIITGVTTGIYILIPKETGLFERYGSMPVIGLGLLLATVFALPGYMLTGATLESTFAMLGGFDAFSWTVFLLGLVVVGTIGGYGLYLYGVSIVGPVRGSLIGAVEPISATIISAVCLGTAFTGFDIAGLILMCVMLLFISG